MRFEIFRKYLNVCYKNLEKLYHIHFTGFNDSFIDLWSESHSVVSASQKGSLRILQWVACPFSSGSAWPRNLTEISCIAGGFFINWTIRDTLAAQLVKNLPAEPGFDLWVGRFAWRRERLPTLLFWLGEFHGLFSSWGHKESDMTAIFTFFVDL